MRALARAAERTGITRSVVDLGPEAAPEEIRAALTGLSDDPAVHGTIPAAAVAPGRGVGPVTTALPLQHTVDAVRSTVRAA